MDRTPLRIVTLMIAHHLNRILLILTESICRKYAGNMLEIGRKSVRQN